MPQERVSCSRLAAHAQLAHVAERHRRAGGDLGLAICVCDPWDDQGCDTVAIGWLGHRLSMDGRLGGLACHVATW